MHLYIKLASCLALLTDNPSNRYTGGNPEQGFWRRFADGLNRKFSFICDAGQSSQELKEKNYLQLYETDEIFGEHCDRRLAGNHQNARTQTLFFHQISDHGKLAVKNEDRMGRRKERTDIRSFAACGSNAHSALVSSRRQTFLSFYETIAKKKTLAVQLTCTITNIFIIHLLRNVTFIYSTRSFSRGNCYVKRSRLDN